jgi:hypothetical protein
LVLITRMGMSRARYTSVVMMVTGHGVKARGFLALGEAIAAGGVVARGEGGGAEEVLRLLQECGDSYGATIFPVMST